MRTRLFTAAIVALTAPVLFAARSDAAVAPGGTTGSVQLVASPPSLAAGAFTSDTAIRVINEQSLTLVASVAVLGVSTNGWAGVKTLTASTCVQSHMIHMDRASGTGTLTLSGSVTFNSDIVGVATDVTGLLTGALAITDPVFANPGTTYPTGLTGRGLELSPLDAVTLPSARRINITLRVGTDMDELRVITLCDVASPVLPETPLVVLLPLSAAALGAAFVIGGAAWRRSRAA
jgi:hypothetical protein